MAKSKNSKGAYYLKKTMDLFVKMGYKVQKTEINYPLPIHGKLIWTKKDFFGADFAAWSAEKNEFCLVQVKATTLSNRGSGIERIRESQLKAQKQFAENLLPQCVRKIIYVWLPKQAPFVEECP